LRERERERARDREREREVERERKSERAREREREEAGESATGAALVTEIILRFKTTRKLPGQLLLVIALVSQIFAFIFDPFCKLDVGLCVCVHALRV